MPSRATAPPPTAGSARARTGRSRSRRRASRTAAARAGRRGRRGDPPEGSVRLRIDAARTSASSGSRSASRRWLRKTPSRSPARVTSIASNPPSSSTASSTSAAPRTMSARPDLMPGSARCAGGSSASAAISRFSSPQLEARALDRPAGAPWRCSAAVARLRTAPPIPTRCGPVYAIHAASASCSRTVARTRLSALRRTGPEAGSSRSLTRTAPSGHEPVTAGRRPLDADQLQRRRRRCRARAVGQRGRVDRRQVAVAGLFLDRQHPHAEAGRIVRRGRAGPAVGGVADRARGDDVDRFGARSRGRAQ